MGEKRLSPEEIGSIMSAKEALKKIGQGRLINVKALCNSQGISRKSAYGYYHKCRQKRLREEQRLRELSERSQGNKAELEALKQRLRWLETENGALKIARMAVEDLKKKGF